MTVGELQAAIPELSPYQIEQITTQIMKYLNLNKELKDTRPTVCPCCGRSDVQFIKKGMHYGKQRYQCKSCGRKFTYDAKQITAHSHQSIDAWITVIEDTLSLKALDETAEKIDVCHETAFNMRHKLLTFLETMAESEVVLNELGATSYNKLAELLQCKKVELKGHDSYDQVYHLNTVNNQHSRIKEMLRQFRGVASKYLNRYLALFTTIVSYAKSSVAESTDTLRHSLSSVRNYVTYSSSQKSGLLAL